jgi:hypothetical protein
MPRQFLRALGLLKGALAQANAELGHLPKSVAQAIASAAKEVADGHHDEHFPVDVFQTGSGTSTNMNANEVIARLASKDGRTSIHPNDHVNFGQSSNDVIPSALLVAAHLTVQERLLPALVHLRQTILRRARELDSVVKTGRTHLMDAVPLTFGQEFSAWAAQLADIEPVLLGDLAEGLVDFGIGQLDARAVGAGHLQLQHDQAIEHLALEFGAWRQLAGVLRILRGDRGDGAVELAAQDDVFVEHRDDAVERFGRHQLRVRAGQGEEQGEDDEDGRLVHARRDSGYAGRGAGDFKRRGRRRR